MAGRYKVEKDSLGDHYQVLDRGKIIASGFKSTEEACCFRSGCLADNKYKFSIFTISATYKYCNSIGYKLYTVVAGNKEDAINLVKNRDKSLAIHIENIIENELPEILENPKVIAECNSNTYVFEKR